MERYIENKLIKAAMNTGPNPMYLGGRTQPPGVVFHSKHTMRMQSIRNHPIPREELNGKKTPGIKIPTMHYRYGP